MHAYFLIRVWHYLLAYLHTKHCYRYRSVFACLVSNKIATLWHK